MGSSGFLEVMSYFLTFRRFYSQGTFIFFLGVLGQEMAKALVVHGFDFGLRQFPLIPGGDLVLWGGILGGC